MGIAEEQLPRDTLCVFREGRDAEPPHIEQIVIVPGRRPHLVKEDLELTRCERRGVRKTERFPE